MNSGYQLDCVSWEITLKCNLKCIHCEFSAGKPSPDELSTQEAIKLCEDLHRLNCKRVILMGGEPFLRKDWYRVSEKIKDLGMQLAFISNGYIIDKNLFNLLQKLEPIYIGVSIDGGRAETHDYIRGVKGSFDRALQFIDRCIELGIQTIVITSVHKLNIKELPNLRDILFDKENIQWKIQITDVEGRFPKKYLISEEEFYWVGEFIASIQKQHPRGEKFVTGAHDMGYHSSILPNLLGFEWNGCPAGLSLLAIRSNGDISGCASLGPRFNEGNIRERSVVDIWNDPDAFAYNRKFKMEDLKGYCKRCRYAKSCKGGCTETSYMATGHIHCDPYCFHRIEQQIKT